MTAIITVNTAGWALSS